MNIIINATDKSTGEDVSLPFTLTGKTDEDAISKWVQQWIWNNPTYEVSGWDYSN